MVLLKIPANLQRYGVAGIFFLQDSGKYGKIKYLIVLSLFLETFID